MLGHRQGIKRLMGMSTIIRSTLLSRVVCKWYKIKIKLKLKKNKGLKFRKKEKWNMDINISKFDNSILVNGLHGGIFTKLWHQSLVNGSKQLSFGENVYQECLHHQISMPNFGEWLSPFHQRLALNFDECKHSK